MLPDFLRRLRLSKKTLLLSALALLGIGLLLFGSGRFSKAEVQTMSDEEALAAYKESLRHEIESLCESVSGVGRATVALALDGGYVSDYAREFSASGNESYVKLGSGSSASGLLLERKPPEILGIGVVCDGGASYAVVAELTALLSATYKLPMTRIHISPAK